MTTNFRSVNRLKISRISIALILLLLISSSVFYPIFGVTSNESGNLLLNATMSQDLNKDGLADYWKIFNDKQYYIRTAINNAAQKVTIIKKYSTQSQKESSGLSQSVAVSPGKSFRLNVYYKVSGNAKVNLQIQWYNNNSYISSTPLSTDGTSCEYQNLVITATAPSRANTAKCLLIAVAKNGSFQSGSAWFRNTQLTIINNPNSKSSILSGTQSIDSSIFSDGFENTFNKRWNFENANAPYSCVTSGNFARSGKYSYRAELHDTDSDVNGSKRSEISLLPREGPNEEHWYIFSTLLPNLGPEDYALDPNSGEILTQWHNYPDAGEEWTSPPLSLYTSNGNYVIGRRWDPNPLSSNSQMISNKTYQDYTLGKYTSDKGKWVDWVFHVRWGWLASQNPKLEVYKNGVKVFDCNGLPNMTNDKSGVYWKLGIYKWDWKTAPDHSIIKKRIVYYDNIKITNTKPSNIP